MVFMDNTAYQALVLVWLGCGNNDDNNGQATHGASKVPGPKKIAVLIYKPNKFG